MLILITEILIFTISIPILIFYFRFSKFLFLSLSVSAVTAFLLEIVNERIFLQHGTFYPFSLLRFPFFQFPVAIVLLGGLYAGTIDFFALKITKGIKNRLFAFLVFTFSVLIFNLSSIFVEKTGILLEYWIHRIDISNLYPWFYLYYLTFVLSGSFFSLPEVFKKEDKKKTR